MARAVCLILGFLLLATGCRFSGKEQPAPTPTPSPRQVLERSSEHLASLRSVGFSLKQEKGTTALMPGVNLRALQGRAALPDRLEVQVDAAVVYPQAAIKMNLVVVGSEAYMTDPLTGAWRRVPLESLPFNFRDLGRTLAAIVVSVEEPRLVTDGGQPNNALWRIAGRVRSDSLRSLLPGAAPGLFVELQLTFDAQERLREAQITGRVLPGDETDVVRVLSLLSFDEPVEIAPPKSVS